MRVDLIELCPHRVCDPGGFGWLQCVYGCDGADGTEEEQGCVSGCGAHSVVACWAVCMGILDLIVDWRTWPGYFGGVICAVSRIVFLGNENGGEA